MRTVNEMAWEQRCAADAEARDWAVEYGRGEFYYSEKWGQLTAIADGTTTLTDVADALAAGTATEYHEALAAHYFAEAADYLAMCALGNVAEARQGHPHEGLADDLGQVPRLVDDDELAAAEQRKSAADAALVEARQVRDAAVDREDDARRGAEADSEEEYHAAGARAALESEVAGPWRTAAAITYREHVMEYGNDGRPEDDRHLSASEVAARAAAITTTSDATGVSEGYVFAELRAAAVAEGSAPGSDNDPDYLAPPTWETFVDRYETGLEPCDSDELMGWADDPSDPAVIAADRAEVQRVYDHLNSDPYYAGPEGNGTKDSSTVYEHAESLVALGYTADNLAQLDAGARAETARAQAVDAAQQRVIDAAGSVGIARGMVTFDSPGTLLAAEQAHTEAVAALDALLTGDTGLDPADFAAGKSADDVLAELIADLDATAPDPYPGDDWDDGAELTDDHADDCYGCEQTPGAVHCTTQSGAEHDALSAARRERGNAWAVADSARQGELAAAAVAEARERYAEYDGGDSDELQRLDQAVMAAEDTLDQRAAVGVAGRDELPELAAQEYGVADDGADFEYWADQADGRETPEVDPDDGESPGKSAAAEAVAAAHDAVHADIQRAAGDEVARVVEPHVSDRVQFPGAAEQASTMERGA